MLVDGDLTLQDGSIKSIELSGDSDQARNRVDTDHDFIDITGDLIIEGGELCVSMIDDFKLRRGQNS